MTDPKPPEPHSCRLVDLVLNDAGTALVCPHGYAVDIPGQVTIDGQQYQIGQPEHEHTWVDATTLTDADKVLLCRDCGTEERTSPTGRVTTTTPDQRKVTGL